MKWDSILSGIIGMGGVLISYLWGGLDTMLTVLISLMFWDFIMGLLTGGKNKELNSEKAFIGITKKKMVILIMVAVSVQVDMFLGLDGSARSLTIYYYVSMEGLSIFENAGKLGFPLPPKLKEMFAQLQEGDIN